MLAVLLQPVIGIKMEDGSICIFSNYHAKPQLYFSIWHKICQIEKLI